MNFLRRTSSEDGQALLIVVLVMVIALTVTLSLVSRSIVNLKTSVEQTNSQKALAAAEAGVEQAIKNNANIGQTGAPSTIGGAKYSAKIEAVQDSNGFLVNGGNIITKNEGAYIWLSKYDSSAPWSHPSWPSDSGSGSVYVYWGDTTGDDKNAALEIVVIQGPDKDNAQIVRYAFDPYSVRATGNNFNNNVNPGTYTINGRTFRYRVSIVISGGLLMRVNPIYASTYVAIKKVSASDTALPDQGQMIISSGCTPDCNTSGNVQRKITVFQGYPIIPAELFPYSLLSP
jgi:hypothetical protein